VVPQSFIIFLFTRTQNYCLKPRIRKPQISFLMKRVNIILPTMHKLRRLNCSYGFPTNLGVSYFPQAWFTLCVCFIIQTMKVHTIKFFIILIHISLKLRHYCHYLQQRRTYCTMTEPQNGMSFHCKNLICTHYKALGGERYKQTYDIIFRNVLLHIGKI